MTSPHSGFTLIELLVAIGIMVMVMGAGTVVFTNFNQRQMTLAASREVQTFLKTAQTYARVKNVPQDCGNNPLTAYEVEVNPTSLIMRAICGSGQVVAQMNKPAALTTIRVVSDDTFYFRFRTLQLGAQFRVPPGTFAPIATDIIIISTGRGSATTNITVNASGVVSDPVLQP